MGPETPVASARHQDGVAGQSERGVHEVSARSQEVPEGLVLQQAPVTAFVSGVAVQRAYRDVAGRAVYTLYLAGEHMPRGR